MHASHMLPEGAELEVVRDILGHANIDVAQNGFGKMVGRTGGLLVHLPADFHCP